MGLVFLFGFFIFILFKLLYVFYDKYIAKYRTLSDKDYRVIAIISVFIMLNPLSPNGNLFNNYLNILYYYIFALNFLIMIRKISKILT